MASVVEVDVSRPTPPLHRRPWSGMSGWWWPMAFLTVPIALYSARYAILGERAYTAGLAPSFKTHPWTIWVHTTAGPVALLLGPLQFLPAMRTRWRAWHRRMGTVYVSAAALLAGAGLYLAVYSLGGWTTHIGFGALALGVLITTVAAYLAARRREFVAHRRWMIRSYALIYAAVTLRVLLPLLTVEMHGDFLTAYRIVSWLCWVPNLIFAEWWLRNRGAQIPAR